MRKPVCAILALFLTLAAYGQRGRSFSIEQLKKPDKVLAVTSFEKILDHLILSDVDLSPSEVAKNDLHIPFDIVAESPVADSLVDLGYHPFFNGMYHAYADHRPFVISPDMIWLLISQGFAMHVISHAESLRKQFLGFSAKQTLVVQDNRIRLDDPNSPWEDVFSRFNKQIATYTGEPLIKTLTSDFSTSTPASRIASQITIMDAMKPYFDFYVLYISCGIPSITLEGTPRDWQKVLDKANALSKYDLAWWTDSLKPILQQFISVSKGEKPDVAFWKDMFKYHENKVSCGRTTTIDGWIVKFFPYDKDGKRTNLKTLYGSAQLPKEIVKVPLYYASASAKGSITTTPLELWAGFVGLKQDTASFSLKPVMGWMVKRKDINEEALKEKLTKGRFSGLRIRVKEIPKALLAAKRISSLEIFFTDSIHIPAEMQNIAIDKLMLHGKISPGQAENLSRLFPNSLLLINGKFQKTKAWPGGK